MRVCGPLTGCTLSPRKSVRVHCFGCSLANKWRIDVASEPVPGVAQSLEGGASAKWRRAPAPRRGSDVLRIPGAP
jgi:hypothetical protein